MMAGRLGLAIHRVVLREDGVRGSIVVEGLPEHGSAAELQPEWGGHVGTADLAGVLILRSTPPQPTLLVRMPEMDRLSALEPESPWLRLDQPGAAGSHRAMHHGLRLPTFELRQGLDTPRTTSASLRCSTRSPTTARTDAGAPQAPMAASTAAAARAASRPASATSCSASAASDLPAVGSGSPATLIRTL